MNSRADQYWGFWPLLPLYPYGRRATHVEELIPGEVWSFEQLQGVYYVAVPIRLTVVKVLETEIKTMLKSWEPCGRA